MVLDLPGIKNIFPHSREFDQGLGKERKGQLKIIVSKDGSGDFDDINEAINSLDDTGGEIFIKKGTYSWQSTTTMQNNTTINGEGFASIIEFNGTTAGYVNLSNLSKVKFSNLRMDLKGDLSSWGGASVFHHINLTGGTDISFIKCKLNNFAVDTNSNPGDLGIFSASAATRFRIQDCEIDNQDSGNAVSLAYQTTLSNSFIINNNMTIGIISEGGSTSVLTECVIMGNYFTRISMLNSGMNRNIIIGNIYSEYIETGDDAASEANVINSNVMTSTGTSVSLGSTSANNNVVNGNTYNGTITDNGSNTTTDNQNY